MAICSIIPAPCASASRPSAGLFHAGRLAARHRRPSLSLGRRPSRPHRSAAVLPSHLRARHKRSQDAPFPGRPHPWVEGVLDTRRGLGAVGDGDHRRRRLEPRGGPSPGGLAPVVSEQVVAVEHQIGKRLPGPGPAVQVVLDLRVVVDVVEAGFPGAGVGQSSSRTTTRGVLTRPASMASFNPKSLKRRVSNSSGSFQYRSRRRVTAVAPGQPASRHALTRGRMALTRGISTNKRLNSNGAPTSVPTPRNPGGKG